MALRRSSAAGAAPAWRPRCGRDTRARSRTSKTARASGCSTRSSIALATKGLLTNGIEDVASGNNSYNNVTGYNAGAGYDLVTGWGSVDMTHVRCRLQRCASADAEPDSEADADSETD